MGGVSTIRPQNLVFWGRQFVCEPRKPFFRVSVHGRSCVFCGRSGSKPKESGLASNVRVPQTFLCLIQFHSTWPTGWIFRPEPDCLLEHGCLLALPVCWLYTLYPNVGNASCVRSDNGQIFYLHLYYTCITLEKITSTFGAPWKNELLATFAAPPPPRVKKVFPSKHKRPAFVPIAMPMGWTWLR